MKVQAELGKLSENCNAGNTQVITTLCRFNYGIVELSVLRNAVALVDCVNLTEH